MAIDVHVVVVACTVVDVEVEQTMSFVAASSGMRAVDVKGARGFVVAKVVHRTMVQDKHDSVQLRM